ncbi:unnamed protein product [Spodoptera littoralis]|uniref:Zinc finger protein n=1 Tax=Spodoptera littoralis TaxID=7109 RepID=A0A9P0N6G1_SPOLI|nr:unnamed protein product [Spodoptera littoralis]
MSENIRNLKTHTCRICLFMTDNVEQFVFLNEDSVWFERFEFCFGIKLSAQDQQQVICLMCSIDIKKFICFKEKCLQSHRLWESLTSDARCNIVKINCTNNTKEDEVKIKSEHLDTASDNDQNFLPDDDNNMNDFSEIKMKHNQNDNLKQLKDIEILKNLPKIIQNNKTELTENRIELIDNAEKVDKKWLQWGSYFKHVNRCQRKRSKEVKVWITPDFVFNCGKKYDGNVTVKIDSENKTYTQNNLTKIQNNSRYSCGLCRNSFDYIQDLFKHLNEHWENNDLACQLCDFVGVDLAAIAAHRYYHYPREGKVHYFCHICRHTLPSLLSLHFHYRKIHLRMAGGYCAPCNKEFPKLAFWKKHEKTKHSAPKYICDICGKGYIFKYSIRDHMMNSHLGIKQHICDICGNCFKNKKYLELHINVVHTKSEPLKCTHCDKMFKSYHTLHVHQKKISMEKNHKCGVCQKAFTNSNSLSVHMAMHSDVRPYSCDICGASYKYKTHVKVHMYKHTGFHPHKCSQCTKRFATTSQLKRHSSVHTGVRRHACIAQNCIKTFHSKKLMLTHLQSRHKIENAEPK